MTNHAFRALGGALLAGTMTVSLSACGGQEDGAGDKNISIGIIAPWSDTRVAAALMTYQAESMGYSVELEDLSDPPLLFAAVAQGDVDVYASAWSERNHKEFVDRYGDQLEDLGSYYDGAGNFLAVPTYSELQSIEDIPDHWDELDGQIIGIEPGAGLTKQMVEDVLPAYGIDKDRMVTSSTTAMLAELQSAIQAQEEVVVTLWSPYWATTEFDVRPLEDPEGAFGETEGMHYIATDGFSSEHPDIADWVDGFQLDEEQFGSLENLILNEYEEGEELDAVEEWLQTYPGVLGEA